jgi:lipopolysaccharide transport system ATP-binding protein
MAQPVISIENVSKSYRLGNIGTGTFYGDLQSWWARRTGRPDPHLKVGTPDRSSRAGDILWALKNIHCQVRQGEALGIIGRNGAGKSTLLKILSQVTAPTSGFIKVKGRIASLLEVGTGFHPELTGRENIFLNGTILGMGRREIQGKFDEIVDFSGVEKFIDTPVKRYSSGMYVRLAFAVAAHLEPDIMIVDEVLAVGDAEFQKKCLGKMDEASKNQGRTVLFVSHNMAAIRALCTRCILLNGGQKIIDDSTDITLNKYHQAIRDVKVDGATGLFNETIRRGEGVIRFQNIEMLNAGGESCISFMMGEKIVFKMSYKVFQEMNGLKIYIALRSGITKEIITSFEHTLTEEKLYPGDTGAMAVALTGPAIRPGEYPLYFHLSDKNYTPASVDVVDDATPPLVIQNKSVVASCNYNIERTIGCFSVDSELLMNDIKKGAGNAD